MNKVKTFFSEDDLKALAAAIKEAEQHSSGEIRVSIRQRRSRQERSAGIEHLAWREFRHLGMAETKERNGVLVFLLLEDRQLYICADSGIHSKVDPGVWPRVADGLIVNFKKSEFRKGLIQAVGEVATLLAEHFPHRPDDVNELPDEVRIK